MVMTGNGLEERVAVQTYMPQEFEMKDLSLLKYFLGIEVSWLSKGISYLNGNMGWNCQ